MFCKLFSDAANRNLSGKKMMSAVLCTRFSGLTAADLKDVETTLTDVQAILLNRFSDKTILMGHSLESDLFALKVWRLCFHVSGFFCFFLSGGKGGMGGLVCICLRGGDGSFDKFAILKLVIYQCKDTLSSV